MNNQANTIKPVTKISIPDTLLSLKVGETVMISARTINSSSVRAAASRLKKIKKAQFIVTEQGLINEIKVTRLK
ncbi:MULTISPECIES: hypothetical protein [Dysgonomonadaceae]|jgi:hypothetical protein|uniref:Uncharacterized protein n=2 Tax=root TaxID=1 RepID=A0A645CXQ7_9ZZZZ|nr:MULTISPECIES: hypothetical protein [Proteiniphilum]MDD3542896.1 hypothetical protein [Petrimonas sp.]BBD44627.1 Hypothetical protein PEIBARAKI_4620 [Petrimonas sp. IBARAKI]MDD4845572.1 hypothetical protein [Petrimonas sp.]MEA5044210.1 hypothetical protein [Petrimonas sp.]ULB34122.1 hypothetical protein KDN43_14275 [Proteiniphilum propionicum]